MQEIAKIAGVTDKNILIASKGKYNVKGYPVVEVGYNRVLYEATNKNTHESIVGTCEEIATQLYYSPITVKNTCKYRNSLHKLGDWKIYKAGYRTDYYDGFEPLENTCIRNTL